MRVWWNGVIRIAPPIRDKSHRQSSTENSVIESQTLETFVGACACTVENYVLTNLTLIIKNWQNLSGLKIVIWTFSFVTIFLNYQKLGF